MMSELTKQIVLWGAERLSLEEVAQQGSAVLVALHIRNMAPAKFLRNVRCAFPVTE